MIATLISFALPVAIWLILISTGPSATRFEMDWGHSNAGSFAYNIYPYYSRLFMVIFWVGLTLGLYIGLIARQEPAGILVLSAVYALVFNIWLIYCYESYLHRRYPPASSNLIGQSNYTRSKYAVTLALAFSAVILFVIGLLDAVIIVVGR